MPHPKQVSMFLMTSLFMASAISMEAEFLIFVVFITIDYLFTEFLQVYSFVLLCLRFLKTIRVSIAELLPAYGRG